LPKKYKDYLDEKEEAFGKYHGALRNFSLLKDYESEIYNIFVKNNQFRSELGGEKFALNELYSIVNELAEKRDALGKFHEEGFMSDEFYQAVLADINADIEICNLLGEIAEGNYSSAKMEEKILEIAEKYKHADLMSLYNESQEENIIPKQREWDDLYSEAVDLSAKAFVYYDSERLAADPLSMILSQFSKDHPKN